MLKLATGVSLAGTLLVSSIPAQVTERVSVSTNGIQQSLEATLGPADKWVSGDGRFIAFVSNDMNLVAGDTNSVPDVFVRDRLARTTERVSIDSAGVQGNAPSGFLGFSISDDGRFVAFGSEADNLVPGDSNGALDVFVRDRTTGTTERVSVSSLGAQGNAGSANPAISADGRYVAFASAASNLIAGDTNGYPDTFVHDRLTGTTERVSISTSGAEGIERSYIPRISADGRYVAFMSLASNLVPNDTNGTWDVLVRDRTAGTTVMASVSSAGVQANQSCSVGAFSNDGRYLCFSTAASNLVLGDTNGVDDAFVRDLFLGTTERVSVSSNGAEANGASSPHSIFGNGRYVCFGSAGTNLVAGDTNSASDLFIRDRLAGTTERVDVALGGAQANGDSGQGSTSADGRYLVFMSLATNLVSGDTNGVLDVFVHDRFASGFTSLCAPGSSGVLACPCGNPPAGLDRGCDNSSSTGGASIEATGIAYLALDSLVFAASGEKPSATSILLQGDALLANGAVFGQGVRCAGGSLKRMYVKTAVNGSLTAPEFALGDPTVSARSAALGAPLQPGQPYLYLAYYRDPIVLGSCPVTSTFNATQTAQISWWP